MSRRITPTFAKSRKRRGVACLVVAYGLILAGDARSQEVADALVGSSATFPNGATATWNAGGQYLYRTGPGGRLWQGRYTMSGERVCVELFEHYGAVLGAGWGAMGTCFRIVRRGEEYMLLDARGHMTRLLVPRAD